MLALLGVLLAIDGGAPKHFDWDVPQLVASARVGDQDLEVDGLPLHITLARSKWKGEQLLQHFTRRFEAAGFYFPPSSVLSGLQLPHISALDPDTGLSYLIYCWPEPDGTTSLVLGAANLKARRPRTAAAELPVFPGARHATSFNMEVARALSFEALATQGEVLDFYRSTLPAAGFTERSPGVFARGDRVVRVVAKKAGEALSVVVLDEPDLERLHPKSVSETGAGPASR